MKRSILRARASGFTLLETVIALGILATAIMSLLIALSASVNTVKVLEQERRIRLELENRLARLQLDPHREFRQESVSDPSGITFIEEIFPENVLTSNHTILDSYRRLRVTAKWAEGQSIQQREASCLVFTP